MTGFTAHCLCGAISLESSADPVFQANCHCDDCRRAGGGVFASYAFVPEEVLKVSGETKSFEHTSDRGTTMTKNFCPACGSQMFNTNSAFPGRIGVRVGVIDDASWFKPMANVYVSRKLPSTLLDADAKAFDKMPG